MTMTIQQFGALSNWISGITTQNSNSMLPFAESRLQYCGSTKRNWVGEAKKASEHVGLNINRG